MKVYLVYKKDDELCKKKIMTDLMITMSADKESEWLKKFDIFGSKISMVEGMKKKVGKKWSENTLNYHFSRRTKSKIEKDGHVIRLVELGLEGSKKVIMKNKAMLLFYVLKNTDLDRDCED